MAPLLFVLHMFLFILSVPMSRGQPCPCFQRQASWLGHFALCLEPSETAEGAAEKAHAAVWVPRRL